MAVFDYAGWKYQSARGIRGGNNLFLMSALFVDKERRDDLALYTSHEEEFEYRGKVWPSAYQIVIQAQDEYDAMRKLVGNQKQWDELKTLEWFSEWLDRALREQRSRQESAIRKVMLELAEDGDKQAAKIVLELAKAKRPVGRPKKAKTNHKSPKGDVDGDSARILSFADRK